MRHTLFAPLLLLALPPATAFAGEPRAMPESRIVLAAAEDARAQADVWKRWAEEYSRDLRSSMGTMFGARMDSQKLVKGAPYSAEIVTESNQNLADGNVISRKTRGAAYRDGEGRTRQEMPGDGKEPSIYISDPVEGRHVILAPGAKRAVVTRSRTKTAESTRVETSGKHSSQVIVLNGREIRIDDKRVLVDGKDVTDGKMSFKTRTGKNINIDNGKVTIDGKELSEVIRDQASDRVVVRNVETSESPDGTRREEVRIQVVRGPDGHVHPVPPAPPVPPVPPAPGRAAPPPPPPVPPMPGVSSFRFESPSRLGKGVTTSLGMKEFDGVKAEGKSTVWTIPAGEIGNKSAINVTSESWYSPDLQLTVYSRYNDPRTGESIYRLASIRRAEPAPDLFKVPADYDVQGRERERERGRNR